jgi:hypothetical protein
MRLPRSAGEPHCTPLILMCWQRGMSGTGAAAGSGVGPPRMALDTDTPSPAGLWESTTWAGFMVEIFELGELTGKILSGKELFL